jgi:hypothetical protein
VDGHEQQKAETQQKTAHLARLSVRLWTLLDAEMVERKGIEPSTFALRTRRSPS